jgi:hypothetical protein
VADISIPDGTKLGPNATFTKTWRIRNIGRCTWTTAYALTFDSGSAMSGPTSINIPGSVAPGQYIDLSVNLTSPGSAGSYKGNWKLRNGSGATFGIGPSANSAFWVDIQVVTATPTPTPTATTTAPSPVTIYDMALNYCAADWVSGYGALTCGGSTSDEHGFVVRADNPKLSNGTTYNGAALETHPEWVTDGVITGRYPAVSVQTGYHFKSTIGCLNGATTCNVTYQLNYRKDGGDLQSYGQWVMTYTTAPKDLDIDLSSVAGHSVEFVLAVKANGETAQNWAIWFNPRIVK